MSVFKFIQISLFLMPLHLTAKAEYILPVLARAGEEVTVSCPNRIQAPGKCDETSWHASTPDKTETQLLSLGRTAVNPARASVELEQCLLVIKRVTNDDAGYYLCKWLQGGTYESGLTQLFVVNVTERTADGVALNCSVRTQGPCVHTVRWLYQGKDAAEDEDMSTSQAECSSAVRLAAGKLKRRELFQCEVARRDGRNTRLYTLSRQSSGDDGITGSKSTAETPTTASPTTQGACSTCCAVDYIGLVMHVIEVLLIVVLLIRGRGNQRPPDDNTARRDGTVNYNSAGAPSASVSVHNNTNSAER